MGTRPLTRDEAVGLLEQGRVEIDEILARLPRLALTTVGVGGGSWSPKDLVGHLASWEEHALDALAAWQRDERAPIDDLWRMMSTRQINDQNVARKAPWSFGRVRRDSERTHDELIAAIRGIDEARWNAPVSRRGRRALWQRLGGILGGPGPFQHDRSHIPSLATFARRSVGS